MLSYNAAVQREGERLGGYWGNLIQRTWHMADQVFLVATKLMKQYGVDLYTVLRDLARIIGNVSRETLEGYFHVISRVREMRITRLIDKPYTGFTQVKVAMDTGLPEAELRSLLQHCYTNDSKKKAKRYTVEEVRTMAQEAMGKDAQTKSKSSTVNTTTRQAAAMLEKVLRRIEQSANCAAHVGTVEFVAAMGLVQNLRKNTPGPLFESA